MTMWPSSAPAPIAPRYGLPSGISPPPTPVPSVSMTMWRVPRPAPWAHSASVAAFASLSIPTGRPKRSRIQARRSRSASGMFTEVTAFPLRWSIVDGIPNPIAATPSASTSSTALARPPRSSSCDSRGVGSSRRRSTVPSRSTTPARIFVPPRSTPITCWGATGRGYDTPPDGARREALPRLPRRPGARGGAASDEAGSPRGRRRRGWPQPLPRAVEAGARAQALGLGPPDRRRPGPAHRPLRRLVDRRLPLVLRRRGRREQARPAGDEGRARLPERPPALARDRHPAARHRPLELERAGGRPALRLDHARPHRPEPPPDRLPVDPARPARADPRPRRQQDQRRVPDRRAGARDPADPPLHRPAREPRRHRRLRELQTADRRRRRDHHRRAGEDPLEPLRLPLREPGALRPLAGMALPEGEAAHERAAGAHLLADSGEPPEPVRERRDPRRASAARRPGDAAQAVVVLDLPLRAVQGRQVHAAALDRPLGLAARPAPLGLQARRREPGVPLPAGRERLDSRRCVRDPAFRRQRPGRPGSARQVCASATSARLGTLRARLCRRRQ